MHFEYERQHNACQPFFRGHAPTAETGIMFMAGAPFLAYALLDFLGLPNGTSQLFKE
jgi:hypothetical protein